MNSERAHLEADQIDNEIFYLLNFDFVKKGFKKRGQKNASDLDEEDRVFRCFLALEKQSVDKIYQFLQYKINSKNNHELTFAHLLAGLDNDDLIEKYLNLLMKLLVEAHQPDQIYKLLKCQDVEKWTIAMHASSRVKLFYINLLGCLKREGITQEEISSLLNLKDVKGKSFLQDTKDKKHSDVIYYLMEEKLLLEKDYLLLKGRKDDVCEYVIQLASPQEKEEKDRILSSAIDVEHPVGGFFWTPRCPRWLSFLASFTPLAPLTVPSLNKGTLKKLMEARDGKESDERRSLSYDNRRQEYF